MGSVSARFGIQLRARVGEENGCEGITTSKEEEQWRLTTEHLMPVSYMRIKHHAHTPCVMRNYAQDSHVPITSAMVLANLIINLLPGNYRERLCLVEISCPNKVLFVQLSVWTLIVIPVRFLRTSCEYTKHMGKGSWIGHAWRYVNDKKMRSSGTHLLLRCDDGTDMYDIKASPPRPEGPLNCKRKGPALYFLPVLSW